MKKTALLFLIFCFLFNSAYGKERIFIEKSIIKSQALHLSRTVQPQRYFDSVGQKSAILGREDGRLETWIYPYKVLHNFELHFLIENENEMVEGKDVVHRIDVYPIRPSFIMSILPSR